MAKATAIPSAHHCLALPLIGTGFLWQGVAEAECRRAGDAAEDAYHKAFRRETAADEASMDAEHHRCMNVAMRAFDAVAIGRLVLIAL